MPTTSEPSSLPASPTRPLTAQQVGRIAVAYVDRVQPEHFNIVVEPDQTEEHDGHWRVVARPDREGVLASDFHGCLDRAEDLMYEELGVGCISFTQSLDYPD